MDKPSLGQEIQLKIHDLGHNGEGVGSYQGYTVFVEGALPGETVLAKLIQCQKKYGRAALLSILEKTSQRVEPPCPLFGKCGGCQVMHLNYQAQLEIKRKRVMDAFERIGKINDIHVLACSPSPRPLQYRNKIQLPVRQGLNGIAIGMYARSSHQLVELDHCLIHCSLGQEILETVQTLIKNSQVQPYDPQTGRGDLRHLLIRSTIHTHESLVILITNGKATQAILDLAKQIITECPEVKGVIQNINQRRDNIILDKEYVLLEGQETIQEIICGLRFHLSAASFFQVNPSQAEFLYQKALEFADLKGDETVLDAYCGVGTLSLIFSRFSKKVIGVECCPEAIEDAKNNSQMNGIDNAEFFCANAENYIKKLEAVDLILLNPPRQGCDAAFLQSVGRLLPKTVIYISCDPATLARDLSILYTFGYKAEVAQPFDMFPQTAHVECVVQLKL